MDFSKPISGGPTALGFDYFFGIPASLDMDPYCYIENNRVTAIPDQTIEASPYDAYWREGPISPDFVHEEVLPTLADKADRFIREQSQGEEPFFLYFPLNAPHTPILPTREFQGRSGAGAYGDFVIQCDSIVGRIMDTLDELGISDNTIIIYSSDNGAERIAYQRALDTGHFSCGPLRGLKRDVWEGGHRIPFIARWPGQIPAGSLCGQTICLTDFYSTAAEITGAVLSDDAAEDSVSILAALRGGDIDADAREVIIHHSCSGRFAVRKGNWVLIDWPTGDDNEDGEPQWLKERRGYAAHDLPGELYDLSADLCERDNLYGKNPEMVKTLKNLLLHCQSEGRSTTRRVSGN